MDAEILKQQRIDEIKKHRAGIETFQTHIGNIKAAAIAEFDIQPGDLVEVPYGKTTRKGKILFIKLNDMLEFDGARYQAILKNGKEGQTHWIYSYEWKKVKKIVE